MHLLVGCRAVSSLGPQEWASLCAAHTLPLHTPAGFVAPGLELTGGQRTGNNALLYKAHTLPLHTPAGCMAPGWQLHGGPGTGVTTHCIIEPKLSLCMHLLVCCKAVSSTVVLGGVPCPCIQYIAYLGSKHILSPGLPHLFLRFKLITYTQNGTLKVSSAKNILSVRTNNTVQLPNFDCTRTK